MHIFTYFMNGNMTHYETSQAFTKIKSIKTFKSIIWTTHASPDPFTEANISFVPTI